MPAFYAHDRFGEKVFNLLSGEEKNYISRKKDIFTIGLQGPDIFFYYKPLKKTPVRDFGSQIHRGTGAELFLEAEPENDAQKVYMCGALCHFTLDVFCHGYIGQYMEDHDVSHSAIEGEFDRELLVSEGHDPVKSFKTEDYHPSEEAAEAVSDVYSQIEPNPGIDTEVSFEAVSSIRKYEDMIRCQNSFKRGLFYFAIKLSGHEKELRGHITNREHDDRFTDSNAELMRRSENAAPEAAGLISEYLRDGTSEDGKFAGEEILAYDFNSVKHEDM